MRILQGGILEQYVPSLELAHACKHLRADVNLYLSDESALTLAKVDDLILSRARPEGIEGAIARMEEASSGTRAKRSPIEVRATEDGFVVLDGNSTVVILHAIGVTSVPVKLATGSSLQR